MISYENNEENTLNAQVSFSSGLPLLVMLMANMNSLPAVKLVMEKMLMGLN